MTNKSIKSPSKSKTSWSWWLSDNLPLVFALSACGFALVTSVLKMVGII